MPGKNIHNAMKQNKHLLQHFLVMLLVLALLKKRFLHVKNAYKPKPSTLKLRNMDSILFWNAVALEANRESFTNGKNEQPGPTLSSRALAIVHLAMYDAYAAFDPTAGAAYLSGLPPAPPPPASAQAAVAAAAYFTLAALYPGQKNFFDTSLSEAGGVLNEGHEFGRTVAQAILADRRNDPGAGADGFVPSFGRGKHKVDPDNPGQGFHAPFYGAKSNGFAITRRFELQPPPFGTPEYIAALRQVRGRGIAPELMGTLPAGIAQRTTDQTLIGTYWSYDGSTRLGTPPRLYNQIIRRIAIAKANTEAQNARLFALINVAMADAGILAWDQKYIHNFWRPVVGIREHDESMGIATTATNNLDNNCDSSWLPLGAPATNSLNQQFVAMQQTLPLYPHNQTVMGRPKNSTPNFPA